MFSDPSGPVHFRKLFEIKINSNFYFHTSLCLYGASNGYIKAINPTLCGFFRGSF